MKNTQKAIELAIEGGWNSQWLALVSTSIGLPDWVHAKIFLDPLFWQALIKDEYEPCWACKGERFFEDFFTKEVDKSRPCGNCKQTGEQLKSTWKDGWHSFIDTLASSQTADEFFATILPADK